LFCSQDILESVLFEPRDWVSAESAVTLVPVPAKERGQLLGTRFGILMQEVCALDLENCTVIGDGATTLVNCALILFVVTLLVTLLIEVPIV
jgi:hypothetical protein